MNEFEEIYPYRANGRTGADIKGIATPPAPAAHESLRGAGTFLREAKAVDLPFLQEMCYLATFRWSGRTDIQENIPTFEEAKAGEAMEAYLGGWGRKGDYGVVAVSNATGLSIGAAWYRRYVQRYPYELTVAVRQEHQGHGVGGSLLRHLLDHASQNNRPEICLKVRNDNNVARTLYERLGFEPISDEKTYEVMVASTNWLDQEVQAAGLGSPTPDLPRVGALVVLR
jgi:GNAT superfamily N-acetyltransferase